MNRFMLALLLAVVALYSWAVQARDTYTSNELLTGLPNVQFTFNGESASVLSVDSGTVDTKRAACWQTLTANVNTAVVLVRLQRAGNGLFLDVIVEENADELDTEMASFNLTSSVPGHPSPIEDAVDSAVIAGAKAND